MLILAAAVSLLAGTDPDGVVSTAPRGGDSVLVGAVAPVAAAVPDAVGSTVTTQQLTTAQQIDRWIDARPAGEVTFEDDQGPADDRQMHGFVSGSIGTDDYSNVSVGVSLPIGETGRLDLAFSQTKNGWFGAGYPGYGVDGLYDTGFYSPRTLQGFEPIGYEPFFLDHIVTPGRRGDDGWGRSGRRNSFSLSYDSNADRNRRSGKD